MAKQPVRVDPTAGPVGIEMRVFTPLFAEVGMYYRKPGDTKWTPAASFDISEVEDGVVSTTVPALPVGSGLLLRVTMWGGDRPYIIRATLKQNQADCHGSPLAEERGQTGDDQAEVVDIEVEFV